MPQPGETGTRHIEGNDGDDPDETTGKVPGGPPALLVWQQFLKYERWDYHMLSRQPDIEVFTRWEIFQAYCRHGIPPPGWGMGM